MSEAQDAAAEGAHGDWPRPTAQAEAAAGYGRPRPRARWPRPKPRAPTPQAREADARAARSEAEGEANALRAEVAALARLVERDTAEGGQMLDRLQVQPGFEKALGAALADDLRAPEVEADGASGLGDPARL